MWVGAFVLTLMVVPTAAMFADTEMLRLNHEGMIVAIFALSTLLLLWCDVALGIEAIRARGRRWVRSSLDWVVWIAAAVLTTWCVWNSQRIVYAYSHARRLDTLLTALVQDAPMLFFDVALIIHAVKTRRTATITAN
jgi:hypothetical protein